jgi:hypothetical protein
MLKFSGKKKIPEGKKKQKNLMEYFGDIYHWLK